MTTIIAIFIISTFLSLILTPPVLRVSKKYNLVDIPSERKVHQRPIPRTGGVVVFIAFYLSFLPMLFYRTLVLDLLTQDFRIVYIVAGSFLAFGLGLWDDIKNLSPQKKILIQTAAALIAYVGGLQIDRIVFPGLPAFQLGWLSIPVTVFWILLVMNAVNLTDGLDGLAAGICFIMCVTLFIMCLVGENLLIAVLLAALSGAIFGFLRYNANPASIFLGDGGSYFLGYMMAVLSILGSIKTHAAVTVLIPLIAMGVPLMDTVWSALRRFVYGRSILKADREHFHHRLLKMGYSPKRAVYILYGVTIFMGGAALLLVFIRDDRAALLLLLLGAAIVIGIRKLGYFDHFNAARFYHWFRDLSDEAGLSHDRRVFFNLQADMLKAEDMDRLWHTVIDTMKILEFDHVRFHSEVVLKEKDGENDPSTQPLSGTHSGTLSETGHQTVEHMWCRNNDVACVDTTNPNLLKLDLPLMDPDGRHMGKLILQKDLKRASISHYTLKRVEHFRRTLIKAMEELEDGMQKP